MSDSAPPPPTAPPGRPAGRLGTWYALLRSPGRFRATVDYLALAVLALVTMVCSQPGVVSDDTKTYLYLDPGRYVRQAVSLWDPNVGLGTVTHENIGYLLPMGPFYWVLAELHVPLWVAQRLWMSTLLFAAGAGALYLCRTIGLSGPGRYVTALAFMFTPYVLQYAGRISVILLPWAGLPWMVAFVILALRRGGWKYPALFALVVALVSGINASSILYVGIAPALWLPYAVWVSREATLRRAWGVAWRIGLLSALVSLWWAVGLEVEAAYGVNVLKYTETVPATSSTSLASEVLRGLGYWYFYGSDRVGSWTQSAVAYSQDLWLVAASFAVPFLAFLAAVAVRWRHRAYFVLLIVVGTVLSVGAYPYTRPSGFGWLLRTIMTDTTAGLAMRSTDRATPLVLLGLAVFLGAGVSAVARRFRRSGLVLLAFGAGVVAAASAPLWTGAIIADGFTQPATPPAYVHQAATALDATHQDLRVYALPGNNFGAYRWGDTIDTVWPGLLTRPFVTHEQQVMGSLPTADTLYAIDDPLQEGTQDWDSFAPMMSLLSVGDVLVQYDQAYERYNTPPPQQLAAQLAVTPKGLSDPVRYGTPTPNVATIATLDEPTLALPPNSPWPAPLVSYTVDHPRPVVRAESLAHPVVVDGDASGIVNAAGVGLLAGNPTIFYAGTLDTDTALQHQVLSGPADLVVTDTNRKQGFRWNAVQQNTGYTETAQQGPDTADPSDEPLNLFPGAPADAQSTAVLNGVSSVTASTYGSSLTYLPEDQPEAALDGDLDTAWLDDSFGIPDGQWWQVVLHQPTTVSSVHLVQPQTGDPDRWITKVALTFDGRAPVTATLGPGSRTAAGQTVTFPARTFTTLRITVDGYAVSGQHRTNGFESSIGFAEVEIPGVHVHEVVALPVDLLRAAGPASVDDRLTILLDRERSSGFPPRSDPETAIARQVWLPTARTFTLSGQARISPLVPDDEIDRLVGRPGADHTGIVAYSQGRLPGDLNAGAIQTLDGSSSTIWEPGFGSSHQAGQWLEYDLPAPVTFDHLDLQIVADGEHSVPTALSVSAGGTTEHVTLPPVADGRVAGSVVDVPVSFAPLTGRDIRITFTAVRIENTVNYYSQSPLSMPIGVAEVGIPGLQAAPVPTDIPTTCRDDLLTVDGRPVWISVSGTSAAALARDALDVSLCGPDATGLSLGPGTHVIQATDGHTSGFDLDALTLDSAAGGSTAPPAVGDQITPPVSEPAPTVTTLSQTSTSLHLRVTDAGTVPFQLVMGQSINAGWVARIDGGSTLGAPVLIDAFANGWRIDPTTQAGADHTGTFDVTLTWTPQSRSTAAVLASALAILVCLWLAFAPRRWRRLPRRLRRGGDGAGDGAGSGDGAGDGPGDGAGAGKAGTADTGVIAATVGVGEQAGMPEDADDDAPVLVAHPFASDGPRSPVWVAVVTGVATGLVAGLAARPVVGLGVGLATVVSLLVPKLRYLLGWAAVGFVLATGTYVVLRQIDFRFAAPGWPVRFDLASSLAWAGVVFLGADAVVEVVLRHQADRRRRAEAAG